MTSRKKRPYVPKIRGCHTCARRRVHCDRTGPHCRKCTSRGLRCTGLGVEIWLNSRDNATDIFYKGITNEAKHLADLYTAAQGDGSEVKYRMVQPLSDHMSFWKRQHFLHFSTHIAFEMVAVDDEHNYWRHLVLPLAYQDELVMNAVLMVSAYHLHLLRSTRSSQDAISELCIMRDSEAMDLLPHKLHMLERTVLAGLRQQCDLRYLDLAQKHSTLMAILVIQVGAMITGRSDFPSLYKMLESAFEASGGEVGIGNNDVAEFITSQVHKFRVYGATVLDEKAGLDVISSTSNAERLIGCLSLRWSEYPEHGRTLLYVDDLVRQAIDMYLDQARIDSQTMDVESMWLIPERHLRNTSSVFRIQHYINTLKDLLSNPMGASCEQVLIWSTFVAASGCHLPEHIQFFERVFLRHYARCGFLNVLEALGTLRKIWARSNPLEKWTTSIAQTHKLIM